MFALIFANKSTKRCAQCGDEILHTVSIDGDRLILRHKERFYWPSVTDGKKWIEVTLSACNHKRSFYYHANSECIYERFREEYFHGSFIDLSEANVLQELRKNPTDLRHAQLHM